MLRRILLVALLPLSQYVAAPAQAAPGKHARVELISQQSSVANGHDLTLGVHFILEKGWHIYWINPGDSGQPPSLQWQLPQGLSAFDIEWPRPDKLQNSPTLADYGYHDDVLLMIPVHVAASTFPAKLDLAVQARWLICREVCIPDHAELKLTLAPGPGEANPQTSALFAQAEKEIPKSWPKTWSVKAQSREEDFLLTVNAGKPIHKAEFYPLDGGQIENAAHQRLQPTPHGCTLILKKSDLLVKPIENLRGLLVFNNSVLKNSALKDDTLKDGIAYQLSAPVVARAVLKQQFKQPVALK